MKLSIVVPVFNEQQSLSELCDRIAATAAAQGYDYEVVFVDDGSRDASWSTIVQLSQQNPAIRGVKLRRNFGKAAALSAGFERVTGDCVVTMDADLQDDPKEIPNLLGELNKGFDVVSGWKKTRHDPWHKVLPSRVFNRLISWLTGVHLHDHNCGLKIYRRAVLSEVELYGERHRFIPVLAAARGFRVSEIVVEHHERKHGVSKYGFERFVKGFLDLMTVYFLTGYGNRPQHLLGTVGLVSSCSGMLGLFFLASWWVVSRLSDSIHDVHLHQKAIFYFCILAVLLGIQLISIGFLAELITAMNRSSRSSFSVSEDTADKRESEDAK
jgi:glycosyltransferase involved in cell wall biosynthesis